MKLIIAGSRTINLSFEELDELLQAHGLEPSEIVNGRHWEGVDRSAWNWAEARGLKKRGFPADWTRLGRRAGPQRNSEMADYGDLLLLIWDGRSSGSASMKREMIKRSKPVIEIIR